MRIGVFLCGEVAPELFEQHGKYSAMFESLFSDHTDDIRLKFYNALNEEFPSNESDCDGYIISGSKYSVYDSDKWIESLSAFVARLYEKKIRTLGICFGHQLIASTLGGEVIKSEKGWGVGVSAHNIVRRPQWLHTNHKHPNSISLLVSHQDQVISLPEHSDLIASSEFCPNAMFCVRNYFLGIQGHPEFNKSFSRGLMQHRRR